MTHPALEVRQLDAWRNNAQVLHNINIKVDTGQLACILGARGSGRTTILRTLSGHASARSGSVCINGTESIHLPASRIKPLGLSYCPDEHELHENLSCEENLLLPVKEESALGGGMSLADIYDIFPVFKPFQHQPIGTLHKPERQLLSIARALRLGTSVLLIDEIGEEVNTPAQEVMTRALSILKNQRYTVIMASQKAEPVAHIADQLYSLQNGTLEPVFLSSTNEPGSKHSRLSSCAQTV